MSAALVQTRSRQGRSPRTRTDQSCDRALDGESADIGRAVMPQLVLTVSERLMPCPHHCACSANGHRGDAIRFCLYPCPLLSLPYPNWPTRAQLGRSIHRLGILPQSESSPRLPTNRVRGRAAVGGCGNVKESEGVAYVPRNPTNLRLAEGVGATPASDSQCEDWLSHRTTDPTRPAVDTGKSSLGPVRYACATFTMPLSGVVEAVRTSAGPCEWTIASKTRNEQ